MKCPVLDAIGASPSEVQGNDVEKQTHAEGHDERDGTEPSEYKSAVAGAGWGRGNSNDVVKSPEYLCQEFDHGASNFTRQRASPVSVAARTNQTRDNDRPDANHPCSSLLAVTAGGILPVAASNARSSSPIRNSLYLRCST